ncbi:hypothetical protein [Flavobacterium sp. UBA7663]|uniref:hypothetical protein n=1 Tax=Flavobacterium sp. UBA7663 TaxID=1946557 RepID=UPI0025B9117A|nr:hypothetical protein [Flavobacterium sp. UBA7663]
MKHLFPIIIAVLLCNCKKPNEVVAYNQIDFLNLQKSNATVKTIDTACINQTRKANADIQRNRLTYFISDAESFDSELQELLKRYNIRLKSHSFSDIAAPEGFRNYCYENLMLEEILKRFGENFLDSITKEAVKNYVINNPDKPYIESGRDLRELYLK